MKNTIILIKFPYTEKNCYKLRPALCLANPSEKFETIIIAYISSNIDSFSKTNDILIKKEESFFKTTGLKTDSIIKFNRLTTILNSNIIGQLGKLPPLLISQSKEKLKQIFKL